MSTTARFENPQTAKYHLSSQSHQKEAVAGLLNNVQELLKENKSQVNSKNYAAYNDSFASNVESARAMKWLAELSENASNIQSDELFKQVKRVFADISQNHIWELVTDQLFTHPETYGLSDALVPLLKMLQSYYNGIIQQLPMFLHNVSHRLKFDWSHSHLEAVKKNIFKFNESRLAEMESELESEKKKFDQIHDDLTSHREKLATLMKPREVLVSISPNSTQNKTGETEELDGLQVPVLSIENGSKFFASLVDDSLLYKFNISSSDAGVSLWLTLPHSISTVNDKDSVEISLNRVVPPTKQFRAHHCIIKSGFEQMEWNLQPGVWYIQFKGLSRKKKSFDVDFRIIPAAVDYSDRLEAIISELDNEIETQDTLSHRMKTINSLRDSIKPDALPALPPLERKSTTAESSKSLTPKEKTPTTRKNSKNSIKGGYSNISAIYSSGRSSSYDYGKNPELKSQSVFTRSRKMSTDFSQNVHKEEYYSSVYRKIPENTLENDAPILEAQITSKLANLPDMGSGVPSIPPNLKLLKDRYVSSTLMAKAALDSCIQASVVDVSTSLPFDKVERKDDEDIESLEKRIKAACKDSESRKLF